ADGSPHRRAVVPDRVHAVDRREPKVLQALCEVVTFPGPLRPTEVSRPGKLVAPVPGNHVEAYAADVRLGGAPARFDNRLHVRNTDVVVDVVSSVLAGVIDSQALECVGVVQ